MVSYSSSLYYKHKKNFLTPLLHLVHLVVLHAYVQTNFSAPFKNFTLLLPWDAIYFSN